MRYYNKNTREIITESTYNTLNRPDGYLPTSDDISFVESRHKPVAFTYEYANDNCQETITFIEKTLEEVQLEAILKVDFYAKAMRDAITRNISPAEMASWMDKKKQAQDWIEIYTNTGNTLSADVAAPLVVLEASSRQCSVESLCQKILYKASILLNLEASIAGAAGKHSDIIKNMTEISDVVNYNVYADWPSF